MFPRPSQTHSDKEGEAREGETIPGKAALWKSRTMKVLETSPRASPPPRRAGTHQNTFYQRERSQKPAPAPALPSIYNRNRTQPHAVTPQKAPFWSRSPGDSARSLPHPAPAGDCPSSPSDATSLVPAEQRPPDPAGAAVRASPWPCGRRGSPRGRAGTARSRCRRWARPR